MTTSIAVQKRRERVMILKLQGMTAMAISKAMGVTDRTIESDLAEVRSEMAKKYQASIGWERLAKYNEGQRLRIGRLWKIVSDKKSDTGDVLKALKELREEENMSIKKDQIAGILPKETTEQMAPMIIAGDNADVSVQQVNIYQTLMQIAQTKEKVEQDLKEPKQPKKPKAKPRTKRKPKSKPVSRQLPRPVSKQAGRSRGKQKGNTVDNERRDMDAR